jgi:acyl-CoA hydrolase
LTRDEDPLERSTHGRLARRITAVEAAGLVKSGDSVDYGGVLAQPDVFDRALAARKTALRDVKIRSCISTRPRAVLEVDPLREHSCADFDEFLSRVGAPISADGI